ncbi:MAG: alpha/beta hydrolase, partial [Gaiellales bacterium]
MAAASADRDPLTGFAYALEPGDGPWTLLLLHGTGGDERDLLSLGRQLAPQATLLAPRGQVMENGVTRRFFA